MCLAEVADHCFCKSLVAKICLLATLMFSCLCFIDDHHCVYTANDVYVCVSTSSVYFCNLCAASWYICLSGHLGPCVCQDAPSFGNSLSRCSIFRQVTLLSSVCICVCVWAFGSSCMSGCPILWQQPVKMFHLSSGDPFVLRVYVCVCLSRCSIFRQVTLLSSVCACVCICVCVWVFGSSCMSGCSILRQQPVKMFHLSSGDPFVLCVCMCVYMCVCLGVWVLVYVRMLHPSATACQDVPSFVR